jgi:hypothetical protein
MMRVLQEQRDFSDRFIAHMLARNVRIEADLVDQLFNSSEKRLARTLLLLAFWTSTSPTRKTGTCLPGSCTYGTVERPSPIGVVADARRAEARRHTPVSGGTRRRRATSAVPTGAGFRRHRRHRRTAPASDALR